MVTNGGGSNSPFRVICEVRPPVRPSLLGVRRQVAMFGKSTDAYLVPENPIGVPTMSSLVVAREVSVLGGSPIAVLNARDRNLLGLKRDILTAVESGTNEMLFVGGDPSPGTTSELSARSMMIEARAFCKALDVAPITVAVASGLGTLSPWKHDADEVFLQASFSLDDLLDWRERSEFDGPVYAGVIVVPSASRARKWSAELPGITVPDDLVAALDDDGSAGVAFACDLIDKIEHSSAFDGVHLIAGVKYREMASHLHLRRQRVAVGGTST